MKSQQKIKSNCQTNGNCKIPNGSKKASFFHINRDVWRFKLHYFLFIGGIAAVFPYVPDYAKTRIGISTTALAMILMIIQFLFVVTKPLIGYLADYFNKLKAIICILTILQGVCFMLILLVPKIPSSFLTNDDSSHFAIPCLSSNEEQSDTVEFHNSIITNEKNIFLSHTLQTVRDLYTNTSEMDQCHKTDLLVPSSRFILPQNKTSQYCKLLTILTYKLKCKLCSQNEKITCDCLYTCTFDKKYCICLSLNTKSNSTQISNSVQLPLQCVCSNSNEFKYYNSSSSIIKNIEDSNKSEFATYNFWVFAILYTIGMASNNAVFTLSDTACCESVEKAGSEFGRQRLWGAIGYGIVAPVAGLINDYTKTYLYAWILMTVCLILVVWNISKLELTKPHFSQNIIGDVRTVLKSGEFLTFEAGILMNGIGSAMIWYYLILFLLSIGASKMLCGLTLTVQSFCGSIPFMFFSGKIIKKFGHLNVVSLALLLYTVRFLWYSYLYNPWLVLIVECLHGLTYGLLYANIASFGKAVAKPGTEATTQSLLFSTHEGIGVGLGCVLGGLGLDHLGGHQTFFISGLFTACGVIFHQIATFLVRRRNGIMKITTTPSLSTIISRSSKQEINNC